MRAQFTPETPHAARQVGRGFQQVLVGGDLSCGGEQQRGHRLVAAHPVLRDVLAADAQRPLGELLLADLGGRVAQHVGDDLVGLEERPQHGLRDQRPLGVQQLVDLLAAGGDVGLPVLVPRHLLGDVLAERRRVGEVEVELQQVAQPHRLGPEGLEPVTVGAGGVGERELDDRGLQEGVDQRVAVERGLVLVFGGDPPHRLAAAVDAGDRMAARQRIQCRPDAVGRAQPQRAVGHRRLLALQVVQRVLQGVVQLVERERHPAGGQQQRRHQSGGVDRRDLQDAPGDLDRHLLQRQAFGSLVGGHRSPWLAEVLAHRHRLGEADVDLAVVAFALGLDEVVEPAQTFGGLLAAAGVRGVFGGLVQLVEADRHRLQQDVVAATVEVGVGDVGRADRAWAATSSRCVTACPRWTR